MSLAWVAVGRGSRSGDFNVALFTYNMKTRLTAREQQKANVAKILLTKQFGGPRDFLASYDRRRMSRSSKEAQDANARCLPTDAKFSTNFDRATNNPQACPPYLTPEHFDGTPIADPGAEGVGDGCCVAQSNELFIQALYFAYTRVEDPSALRNISGDLKRWIEGKTGSGQPSFAGVTAPSPICGGLKLSLDPSHPWYKTLIQFLCIAIPEFEIEESSAGSPPFERVAAFQFNQATPCHTQWNVRPGVDDDLISAMNDAGVHSSVYFHPSPGSGNVVQIDPFKCSNVTYDGGWHFVDLDYVANSLRGNQLGRNGFLNLYADAVGLFNHGLSHGFNDICLTVFQALQQSNLTMSTIDVKWGVQGRVAPAGKTSFPVVTAENITGIVFNMIEHVKQNLVGEWVSSMVAQNPGDTPTSRKYEIRRRNAPHFEPSFKCHTTIESIIFAYY